MVESGHNQIRSVKFDSPVHKQLPVEVIHWQELVSRVGRRGLVVPQRPSFHALLLFESDQGSHTVDFTTIIARRGRLIQIRPGQVQIWNTEVDLDATIVLAQPSTTSIQPWFPGHRSYCDLTDEGIESARALIDLLRRHQAVFHGDRATGRIMIAVFDALLAVFDQAGAEIVESELPEVYVAFRNAIEADLTHRHTVVDYAHDLGYSARTITRACQRATGLTAKRVLTDRLVLEAKRLLVHTDLPAAAVSTRLGFSEPTNFTKFFARHTGHTPSRFRRLERGGSRSPAAD